MQVCKFSIANINVSLGVSQQKKLGILCLPNTAIQSQQSLCKIAQLDSFNVAFYAKFTILLSTIQWNAVYTDFKEQAR